MTEAIEYYKIMADINLILNGHTLIYRPDGRWELAKGQHVDLFPNLIAVKAFLEGYGGL